jgi:hypothetical protein
MQTIIPDEITRLKFIQAQLLKWAAIEAVTKAGVPLYKALADFNALVR